MRAGEVTRAENCVQCGIPLWTRSRRNTPCPPGCLFHAGRGLCTRCYSKIADASRVYSDPLGDRTSVYTATGLAEYLAARRERLARKAGHRA